MIQKTHRYFKNILLFSLAVMLSAGPAFSSAQSDGLNLTGDDITQLFEDSSYIKTLVVGCGRTPFEWKEKSTSVNAWRQLQGTSNQGNHEHKGAFRMAESKDVNPDILFDITADIPAEWHNRFETIYLEKLPIDVLENPKTFLNCFQMLTDDGEIHFDVSKRTASLKNLKMNEAKLNSETPFTWYVDENITLKDLNAVLALKETPGLSEYHKYSNNDLMRLFFQLPKEQKQPMIQAIIHSYTAYKLRDAHAALLTEMMLTFGYSDPTIYRVGGESGTINLFNNRTELADLFKAKKKNP